MGRTPTHCWEECRTECADCPAPRLLPEAQPGVVAYRAVSTQWRYASMGGRTGLDYDGVVRVLGEHLAAWQAAERAAGAPGLWCGLSVADLLRDVQIIEGAVLAVEQERREQEEQQRRAEAARRGMRED